MGRIRIITQCLVVSVNPISPSQEPPGGLGGHNGFCHAVSWSWDSVMVMVMVQYHGIVSWSWYNIMGCYQQSWVFHNQQNTGDYSVNTKETGQGVTIVSCVSVYLCPACLGVCVSVYLYI